MDIRSAKTGRGSFFLVYFYSEVSFKDRVTEIGLP